MENRTTEDLIAEMDANAEGYSFAMLAVAFENTTVFIQHADPNRQKNLDDAVVNGGEPFGWFRVRTVNRKIELECGLLREHAEEPAFQELLNTLNGNVRAVVESQIHGAN
jgi:hypothetical protein